MVNQSSQASQQIAAYYAQKRGIPTAQILAVAMPTDEEMKRADWDRSIRPAIRRWIAQNRLQDKVRCFVTTWDVPLKIGKESPPSSVMRRQARLLQLERQRRMERLIEFITQFDNISPDPTAPAPEPVAVTADSELKSVTEAISSRIKSAELRIGALTEGTEKQASINKLTQLTIATAGLQVLTQNMQRAIQENRGNERMAQEFHFGRGRLTGLSEAQNLIGGLPPGIERDTNSIVIVERAAGIVGTITWIDSQLKALQDNETYASFDSELSKVLESSYPIYRWVPNYLHYNYEDAPLQQVTRTLMVSRLEAPTLPLTKALIDNAVAVEATGLTGKVYLDARGVGSLEQRSAAGSMEELDSALLRADQLLKQYGTGGLEPVLNNNEQLFQAGECPDAAIYFGWVSLAQYVDAFTWKPGSIGYHMASEEARTIRGADSQVWCKRMLDEGITATMGPVYEPYLLAFPKPDEFLVLLLSGKYTYAEVFYRTKTTNSWTMTAIGDPLYNPFKNKPGLRSIPEQYQRVVGE